MNTRNSLNGHIVVSAFWIFVAVAQDVDLGEEIERGAARLVFEVGDRADHWPLGIKNLEGRLLGGRAVDEQGRGVTAPGVMNPAHRACDRPRTRS